MNKLFFFLFCISIALLAACTKMDKPVESQKEVCTLNFNGAVMGYDNITTKFSTDWITGDQIYILFYKPDSTKVIGVAVYSATEGWKISYEGSLTACTNAKCEVRYFENPSSATDFVVGMKSSTVIYEDSKGTYTYTKGTSSSTITVNASLQPKSARIRFKGTAKDVINVTGISTYSSYSISNIKYTTTTSPIKLTVDSTGYTPYVYGFFDDTTTSTSRLLGLVTKNNAFTKTCDKEVLKQGLSGYMTIPSADSYSGWIKGLYLTVKGVEFKMIPVEGLSSGFYLIGETEITGALYNRVINSSSTSTSQYPAVGLYYSEFISFISNLNGLTGLNFNLPSKTQWEYAAKGGKYSMGFTYSGSDIPDDVAWYSSNSGGSSHIVKQKSPNELGIYDMSGNVAEFVLKERAASTTYWYWYRMGGSYSSASPSVGSKSNSYSSSTSSTGHDSSVWGSDIGARLALTFN